MSYAVSTSGRWKRALAARSIGAPLSLLPRAAGAVVLLVLTLAIAAQIAASSRLAAVSLDARAALREAGALAAATDLRAASGSAADGDSGRLLQTNLAAAERDLEASMQSAVVAQRRMTLAVAGVALLALLVLAAFARATMASLRASAEELAAAVDALARGDTALATLAADRVGGGRLDAALRRLARQLRENTETAHALAAGAYRRATRTVAPRDPMGLALAQITANMERAATAAGRIARGDLSVTVVPQSDDDLFGQAHAGMTRRMVGTLRDVEATRQAIAATIEAMRGDAAALASGTSADADRLRRASDRVSSLALQASADADRGEAMVERADEREALLDEGASALQASLNGLKIMIHRAGSVQRLARDAALLAAREGGAHEDDARALAASGAAAARDITHIMIDGSEQAYESGVALDRVALAAHEGTALVRELNGAARQQATELRGVDDAMVQLHATTTRNAEAARLLAAQLDALASHARALDTILRRVDKGRAPVIRAHTLPGDPKLGPVLYRTPPHAQAVFPNLQAVAI